MTKSIALILSGITVFIISAAFSNRTESSDPQETTVDKVAERMFIGTAKCRTCHKKVSAGEQYKIWSESAHAQAYARLASEEAKAIAAEKGLGDPQQAPECLECHVTAYGVDASLLGPKYSIEDGVGCESCHGPGGDYYKKKTMTGLISGDIDPESVGFVRPTEETCTTCHNERSPSFKDFDFMERKAKIAHPIPDETRAKYTGE